jgi:hypothetical protein
MFIQHHWWDNDIDNVTVALPTVYDLQYELDCVYAHHFTSGWNVSRPKGVYVLTDL